MKTLKKQLPLIWIILLSIMTIVACRKDNNASSPDATQKEDIEKIIAQTPTSVSIDEAGAIHVTMKDGSKFTRHLPKSYSVLNKHITDSNGRQNFVIPLVLNTRKSLAQSSVSNSEVDGGDVNPGTDAPVGGFAFTVHLYIDVEGSFVKSYNVVLDFPIQTIGNVTCRASVVFKNATSTGYTATWSYTVLYRYSYVGQTSSFYSSQTSYSTTRSL